MTVKKIKLSVLWFLVVSLIYTGLILAPQLAFASDLFGITLSPTGNTSYLPSQSTTIRIFAADGTTPSSFAARYIWTTSSTWPTTSHGWTTFWESQKSISISTMGDWYLHVEVRPSGSNWGATGNSKRTSNLFAVGPDPADLARLPATVHLGIKSGQLHNNSNGWHGNDAHKGALDFNAGFLPSDSFPDMVFSGDIPRRVTFNGHTYDIYVLLYGVVTATGTVQTYTKSGDQYIVSHVERWYNIDVCYDNPRTSERVVVARIFYTHLTNNSQLVPILSVGTTLKNGDRIGKLATWSGGGYRYRKTTNSNGETVYVVTSTTPHLHIEVRRAGYINWADKVYTWSGFSGRFVKDERSPVDFGKNYLAGRVYSWNHPVFYFNGYRPYDPHK